MGERVAFIYILFYTVKHIKKDAYKKRLMKLTYTTKSRAEKTKRWIVDESSEAESKDFEIGSQRCEKRRIEIVSRDLEERNLVIFT